MGSCSCRASQKSSNPISMLQLQYSRQALIKIQGKSLNNSVELLELAFHLTEPFKIFSDEVLIDQKIIHLSYSILPGLDPFRDLEKICQDMAFAVSDSSSVFLGLYDGHGSFGQMVVEFCSVLAQKEYLLYSSFDSPTDFLNHVTSKCSSELQASNIDIALSGCTQVLCLIENAKVYCATLGDSRAVLATSNPPEVAPLTYSGQFHTSPALEQLKKRRNSQLDKYITALQLTFDQKPDLPEEMARITQAGGRVAQLQTENGAKIGPFRVWELESNVPGLSVSRALGDSSCTKLGIISEPICSTHSLSDQDYFLVIASDGIWDVMDNDDVVNFVESYRYICKKKVRNSVQGHLVNPTNSCIAQMLCEEARVRWFSVIKEERVNIDDISCVICEIKKTPESVIKNNNTVKTVKTNELKTNIEDRNKKNLFPRDPRRGSLALPTSFNPVQI